jgi:hypothetical protein
MTSLLETPLVPHETRGEDVAQHVIQRSRGSIDADHAAYGLKGQTAHGSPRLNHLYTSGICSRLTVTKTLKVQLHPLNSHLLSTTWWIQDSPHRQTEPKEVLGREVSSEPSYQESTGPDTKGHFLRPHQRLQHPFLGKGGRACKLVLSAFNIVYFSVTRLSGAW